MFLGTLHAIVVLATKPMKEPNEEPPPLLLERAPVLSTAGALSNPSTWHLQPLQLPFPH